MMAHVAAGLLVLVAAAPLPLPPTPPPPAPAYVPAPVPDPRFDAPAPRAKREVGLGPALTDTQAAGASVGGGYAYGSAFDRTLTRHTQPNTAIGNRLAPGFAVTIPLE